MPNQFVAKNGLISNGNIVVSGSIVTTGTLQGSASYATSSGDGIHAWATWTVTGTTTTAVGGSNVAIARLSVGLYSFIFQSPFTMATYAVVYTGESGSIATPTTLTASMASVFAKTINGFTMSLCSLNSALVRADATSGSVMVIGY